MCPIFCDPRDCSLPGSSVHGILRARILEWVTMPSSRGSCWPRFWTHISYVSCIGRWVLYHLCHLGSPCKTINSHNKKVLKQSELKNKTHHRFQSLEFTEAAFRKGLFLYHFLLIKFSLFKNVSISMFYKCIKDIITLNSDIKHLSHIKITCEPFCSKFSCMPPTLENHWQLTASVILSLPKLHINGIM